MVMNVIQIRGLDRLEGGPTTIQHSNGFREASLTQSVKSVQLREQRQIVNWLLCKMSLLV